MAHLGHEVVGIDVDEARVATLAAGVAPFHEPGFDALLQENLPRLSFTTDMSAVKDSTVHFIAVGTPQAANGSADMTYVNQAIESLTHHLSPGDLVVGKSTVPVGTATTLAEIIAPTGAMLMWNPEFLREGFAVKDTLSPDRLVYGLPEGDRADEARDLLDTVYEAIIAQGTPRLLVNYATAELVKVAANSFLATKISFINAMAEIADVTGANVTQLADAIGHDNRIGRRFLNAGIGFGGGCLPKDIRGFVARAEELGVGESLAFLKDVDDINLRRRRRVRTILEEELGDLSGKRIALWGLAFKPDSDDIRDSPALDIGESLARAGAIVTAFDPAAHGPASRRVTAAGLQNSILFAESPADAATGADGIVVATEWSVFRDQNPEAIAPLVNTPLVVDGRNCLQESQWKAAGFTYRGMGRS
jgi:UDPglucose 6-dehydrogenase